MVQSSFQNIVSYEDALRESLIYFNSDELATRVFLDKYALRDKAENLLEKTPDDMHWRIAEEVARIEQTKYKCPYTKEFIFSYLYHFEKIIPQGSPMYGIGNPFQFVSLSNCFVLDSPEDSYGGILNSDEQLVQICKRRGGVGLDISNLRPNRSPTSNASRTSTGIIPFMERYSNSIREVGQSGRRGALMITVSVHHPEIEEFIQVKSDKKKVTGANISVRLTDEFLNAVTNDTEYELRWPVNSKDPKISNMVSARKIWNLIIDNAYKHAEPGILFWDTILRESPSDCYKDFGFETISTNPCSEIPLCKLDSCRLLVVNLFHAVKFPFTQNSYFDFEELFETVYVAQRIMDDIIDLELEAIDRVINKIEGDPESLRVKRNELDLWKGIKEKCIQGRRTGTGPTAVGDAMAAIGIKYGSPESLQFVDKVYKTIKLAAYRSSVDMAKELGCFPIWNKEVEKDCPFLLRIKDEDTELWNDMQKYGRRNIALLTTAPAGSTSLVAQTTSGIEPLFMQYFIKRKKINANDENTDVDYVDLMGDKWQNFRVYHPKLKMWMDVTGETDDTKSPWYGCCAEDLDWTMRVKLQATAQKHVDHAISSTVNLPEYIPTDVVARIYTAAWAEGCKGMTVYRKNCRSGVLIEDKESKEEVEAVDVSIKRPKSLDCDIYHPSVKGEQYFVIVSFCGGKPYEVFAGKNGTIKAKYVTATVTKVKKGVYRLHSGEDTIIENISAQVEDDQEAITRLVSLLLRHGNDLSFVVLQLEKVPGHLLSFSKAIARILKKYIPDGTKVNGEECPTCQTESLIRQEGCVLCKNCGWTKCS
jgi:ribonucleoside-diphosphate reductase alpha chain